MTGWVPCQVPPLLASQEWQQVGLWPCWGLVMGFLKALALLLLLRVLRALRPSHRLLLPLDGAKHLPSWATLIFAWASQGGFHQPLRKDDTGWEKLAGTQFRSSRSAVFPPTMPHTDTSHIHIGMCPTHPQPRPLLSPYQVTILTS